MKKEQLKQKQAIKKQEKAQREQIINRYIDKVNKLLEDAYIKMAIILQDFNEELMKSTLKYDEIKTLMIATIKNEEEPSALEELAHTASLLEDKNNELYKTILSRSSSENKILRELSNVSYLIAQVIDDARNELDGKKNDVYIVSIIIDRTCKKFTTYNEYIMETSLEANEYVEAYIDAREDFVDFIKQLKEQMDEITSKHLIEDIDSKIKHRERIRISYYEMESFLTAKGFESIRQGNTTHAIWKNKQTGVSIPVPNKSRTMPQGTVSKILRMIDSNRQELAEFLYQ